MNPVHDTILAQVQMDICTIKERLDDDFVSASEFFTKTKVLDDRIKAIEEETNVSIRKFSEIIQENKVETKEEIGAVEKCLEEFSDSIDGIDSAVKELQEQVKLMTEELGKIKRTHKTVISTCVDNEMSIRKIKTEITKDVL